jgi:hypothetical protein
MQNVETVEIVLSEPQEALLNCRQPVIGTIAGQGGGKSWFIGVASGIMITSFPRVRGFIGANTYDQLSGATLKNCYEVWREKFALTEYSKDNPAGSYVVDKRPPPHFQRFINLRSYKNVISFWNGCIVFIGSLDNYEAQDGKEYGWAHLDETKDTKEEAVKEVILGRLRQIGLWYDVNGDMVYNADVADATLKGLTAWDPLYIHTSPASGLVTWVNEWFELEHDRDLIKKKCEARERDFYYKVNPVKKTAIVIYSAYHNKHNLAPGYLENREATLGPERTLKLIHGYPFAKSGGEYFPAFDKGKHVQPIRLDRDNQSLHLTWDFNVVPYMTCLVVQMDYVVRYLSPDGKSKSTEAVFGWQFMEALQIKVIKEYCLENPKNDVISVCNEFIADFPASEGWSVDYYGDATGKTRKSGLGQYTDFKEIDDQLSSYVHNNSDHAPKSNPENKKRRDVMNDILSGRMPEVEIVISDECEILTQDMSLVKEGVKGKMKPRKVDENTGETYEWLGHTSDALEYLVMVIVRDFILK